MMAYKSHRPRLPVLVVMLMATLSWPTTRAFDFFSGRHYTFKHPSTKDTRHNSRESWEPSSLWWRNRRSAEPFTIPSQHALPQVQLSIPLPLSELASFRASTKTPWMPPQKQPVNDNLGPEENDLETLLDDINGKHKFDAKPLFRSKFHLTPKLKNPLSLKKLLAKIKKMKEIKNALRMRDKSDRLLNSPTLGINSVDPDALVSKAVDQLQKIERSKEKLANTIKSRRAKLLGSSYRQYANPSQLNQMDPSGRSKLSLSASKFMDQPPAQDFPSVEWFSSPRERPQPPSSHMFQGYIPPSFLESGPVKNAGFSSPIKDKSVEGMFQDSTYPGQFSDMSFGPVNSFDDISVQDSPQTLKGSPFPGRHTGGKPYKVEDDYMVGFWGDGGFKDENEDCENISTKVCYTDQDCSCHGFYVCSLGHCDIKSNTERPSGDTWHEEPVDFGFLKRHDSGNKMAGDVRQTSHDEKHPEHSQQNMNI